MADIKLDPMTHDVSIENYKLVLLEGVELIEQRLRQRLKFFRGEWYLDTSQGVPYFQEILRKGISRARVESALKQAIVTTPGVLELVRFEMDYDPALRELRLNFRARVEGDQIVELQVTL